ncbi:kinase-like domain-containing protein [Mycena crocata]|nr:kinase-like domain-containing protein [Mycena crocata]
MPLQGLLSSAPSPYLTLPEKEFLRIERYSSGGFHPVHLGEEYGTAEYAATSSVPSQRRSRYRILHKLGDGAYSQVWFGQNLASTNPKTCGVAMKFVVSGSTGKTNEVAINEYLASLSLLSKNIMACLDIFQVDGPNGAHSVIVTSPSIFLFDLYKNQIIDDLEELDIVRQIFQGLAFLHLHGVVHRDLHIGNIAIEFPFLSTAGVDTLMRASLRPECTPCIPRSRKEHSESVPNYFVDTPKFCEELRSTMRHESKTVVVKILDFGCAFRPDTNDTISYEFGGPNFWLKAPECIISELGATQAPAQPNWLNPTPPLPPLDAAVWTPGSDIWTLGCSLFTLFNRWGPQPIFYTPGCSPSHPETRLLGIGNFLGPLPEKFLAPLLEIDNESEENVRKKYQFSATAKDSWTRLEQSLLQSRRKQIGNTAEHAGLDTTNALRLLKLMLQWDPEARVSAKDALNSSIFGPKSIVLPPNLSISGPSGEFDWQSAAVATEYPDPCGRYMWSVPIATAESPAQYCLGGLHPVHLDEVYSSSVLQAGQYRIIDKLEFGDSAHVWFAQNVSQDDPMARGVSIKFMASRYTGKTNELAINKFLATKPRDDLGFRSFLPSLDVFQVHGPNGTHDVFVADRTIRLSDVCVNNPDVPLVEDIDECDIVRQILQGVSFLHKHGVVHRNLRCENIGITFPFMDALKVDEIMRSSPTSPNLYPCILSDPRTPHPPSLPRYIVKPAGAWDTLKPRMREEASSLVVKLLDFGHAYRPGTTDVAVPDGGPPLVLTAPECVVDPQTRSNWSFQSDIWALGCSLFELHSRKFNQNHLFGGSRTSSLGSEIAKLLGPVPESFRSLLYIRPGSGPLNEGSITQPPVDPAASAESYDAASVAANWGLLRVSLLDSRAPQPSSWFPSGFFEAPLNAIDEQIRVETETNAIEGCLSLMKLMLRWNPEDRISAEEALKLPLFQQVSQ